MPVRLLPPAPIDIRVARRRFKYLDRLIALGPCHPSKRAAWLKFCHICGADISRSAKRVRVCDTCRPDRAAQRVRNRNENAREGATRQRWRGRIRAAATGMGIDFRTVAAPR
jgi:hypothetical protein